MTDNVWPELARGGAWLGTRDHLHLVSQMLGKLRVALAPTLPQWFHAPLDVTPRGLTTRLLPIPGGSLEATLDVVDGAIRLSASGGRAETIELSSERPIATVWAEFRATLERLGVDADLWDKPQERADVTRLSLDDRPRSYDPTFAAEWLALITDVHGVFAAWRSPFFGRSGVNFWWGGFDLSLTLYNGRHATPRPGSGYLQRYDLDAEHLSIGFWPGDADNDAMFFAYLVPQPPDCEVFEFAHTSAAWAPTMEEWVLPYEAVRSRPDRDQLIRTFMDAAYRAAGELAGWDLDAFTYVAPPPPPRPG
jgi:uncharacterized protein DUF5996